MKDIRYGIVGLGNQGSHYLFQILEAGKVAHAVASAVCDNDPKRLESAKAKMQREIAYFDSYIDMLDSGLVDAVLVETPHYFHPEIVIACLKRNIHVICDKPAGVYTKHVREMNEVAATSSAKFAMMFNQRTNCLYRKMREMIADGAIGELQRVNWIITDWFRTQKYYDNGSWRATWDGEGGGVLINQCPHQLDLVSWVVGKQPSAVRGFCQYGKWHDVEIEDEVTAYFEYDNGATGVFITTTGETPGTNRFEVSGTKGKLLCEGGKLYYFKNAEDSKTYLNTTEDVFSTLKHETTEVETDGKHPEHVGIIENFTNALLGTEELFVDGREGIRGVELMNAIEYSGWMNGELVTLPIDEDMYLKELNAHRAKSRVKAECSGEVADTAGSFGSK